MRILRVFLLLLISFTLGYTVGVNKIKIDWQHYRPQISITSKEPPEGTMQLDLSQMWVTIDKLQANYYDRTKIDAQKMLHGAISGLVSSLDDPYTVYLPPKQNSEFKQTLSGQFEGIGAELGMQDKQIIIVAPLEGSPAQKAGLRAGDAVMKVDNQSTFGWTLAQAVEKIRGPKGTKVLLSIGRKGEETVRDVSVVRDTIHVRSVYLWIKKLREIDAIDQKEFQGRDSEQKIAYIRLSQFGDRTNQEWLSLVNDLSLKMQSDDSIKGLVLDLRNNPGGYLNDATFIASEFLPVGTTVVMQEDGAGNTLVMKVERQGLLQKIPLVVLINKGSASASEILSGALREYKRARLVGETSFGKGTIQSAEDLGEGAGLHITVAKWLTPQGNWIHQKGLEPDIKVELDKKNPARDTQLEKAVAELVK
jgi:carboxyl-terminal processing protease